MRLSNYGSVFNFKLKNIYLKKIKLSLLGEHQVLNTTLALTTLYILSTRDNFQIDEGIMRNTLQKVNFYGRMDSFRIHKKQFIIDGAHNVQKMCSLLKYLDTLYPNNKFVFLIAFKSSKNAIQILQKIIPRAKKIIITEYQLAHQDIINTSMPAPYIAILLNRLRYNKYRIITPAKNALDFLQKHGSRYNIITGSLYLIGNLYPYLPYTKRKL